MVKHVLKNLIWLFAVFVMIIAVNYYADPANLTVNERFFDKMLDLMQQGYNIEHVADYKDRLFQKKASEVISKPETLILGSSRVQQIDTAICGSTTWNAGVSGGTTEDICALYKLFSENGKVGDRVIIGIDIWTFNGDYRDKRAGIYLSDALARFKTEIEGVPAEAGSSYSSLPAMVDLTTLSYFQSSVKFLMNNGTGQRMKDLVTSTESTSVYGMLKYDGSYAYPNSYIYVSQTVVDQRVSLARGAVVEALLSCKGIDPELQSMFEALCSDIIANGSDLILLISPIHPNAYWDLKLSGGEHVLLEIEEYLHAYAASSGATVIGSFNPENCVCDYSDFMDALHVNYTATARLWTDILSK